VTVTDLKQLVEIAIFSMASSSSSIPSDTEKNGHRLNLNDF